MPSAFWLKMGEIMIPIKIAELVIGIHSESLYIRKMCGAYKCENEKPDFEIAVTDGDIMAERMLCPTLSSEELESLAIYRALCLRVLDFDCIIFHSSALELDGEGYLFAAASGIGKSTHTRMWREVFGERVIMIDDDKPLLRRLGDIWYVCGTPWNGKHCLGSSRVVPLKGICLLSRDKDNKIYQVQSCDVLPALLSQTLRPGNISQMDIMLRLMDSLLKSVPVYSMRCTMSHEAAQMSYRKMKGMRQA